jgi:hypothetical protein
LERTYSGYWWTPDDPDSRVAGILTLTDDNASRLKLVGGFVADEWEYSGGTLISASRGRKFPLIHGEANGTEITLVKCKTAHSNWHSVDEFVPLRIMVGVHLLDQDTPDFVALTLQLENLHTWLRLGKQHAVATVKSDAQAPEPLSTRVDGVTYTAAVRADRLTYSEYRDFGEVQAGMISEIVAKADHPLSYNRFEEIAVSLMDLLTLSAGEACAVLSFTLEHREKRIEPQVVVENTQILTREVELPRYVEVISQWIVEPKPSRSAAIPVHQFLITCADMPFGTILPNWFRVHNRVREATNILFSLYYGERTFVQTQLLIAGVAAESMHRNLMKGCLKMYPSEFDPLKEKLLTAAEKFAYGSNVDSLFRNEPSYFERASDLARLFTAPGVVDKFIPDIEKWAQRLRDARNGLAHSVSTASSLDVTDSVVLLERTKHLLSLVLLAEMTVAADTQIRAAETKTFLRKYQ